MFLTVTAIVLSLQLLLCCYCVASPPESLRLVSVLYRHGDRSPIQIYPTDINTESSAWPDGLGWLTNIGKNQQYELGKFLQKRYDGFLNTSHYNHNEILVQSSAVERCLMSAYCNLAGLFPPQGSQEWNPNIHWQPIPVQTSPAANDNKLAETAPCPRYDQLMTEVLNSNEIKKEEAENKDFYAMVEKNTGVKQESVKDIWQVADTLTCEKAHNLTWNDWVTPEVWAKLDKLKTLSFDIAFANTEMIRLKGGPLLSEIITNMESANNHQNIDSPKFYMYSAHDTTVASLLTAMHVFDSHQPMYRALVIVELHEINNVSEVRIFYKNETTREPYELSVPGCGSICTLETFKKLTFDHIPGNWSAECMAKEVSSLGASLTPASWIALAVGISLCIAVIVLVIMTTTIFRKNSVNYSKI